MPPPMPANPALDISVVIPAYNEQDNVIPLWEETRAALMRAGLNFEVIFVDDGSSDATFERLRTIAVDPRAVIVRQACNYGQSCAMAAGIQQARGRVIAMLDGDRQNDPTEIPRLLVRFNELNAASPAPVVVCGWRQNRQDDRLRTWVSKQANAIIARSTGVQLHDYGCTLKLFPAALLKSLPLYGEMHRFIPIYARYEGATIVESPVNHRPRTAGVTKYGLDRTFRVILDLATVLFLTKHRGQPMRFFGYWIWRISGAAGVLLALGLLGWIFRATSGFPWVFMLLGVVGLVCAGVLFGLGLIAELAWRTHFVATRQTPYRVAEVLNAPSREIHI